MSTIGLALMSKNDNTSETFTSFKIPSHYCYTAGYLGTSTSQPDLFILGDENVIHPLTGVPCTLSTYSERVISTSFKRESFQIGRFIEGKDHPLDVLTGNDEKFVATVATML